MSKNGSLEFKYDNYEDDLKNREKDQGVKEDFNMQTDFGSPAKKKTEKKEDLEDEYAHDFEDPDKPSPRQPSK